MSSNKLKRINTVIKQLQWIHEQLFGQKYSIGLSLDQKSEFKKIIMEFRQLIHVIRCAQEQRQRRENERNYKSTPDKVRINNQIRQDIEKASAILKQARKRLQTGQIDEKILQDREKDLKNCYDAFQDVKQCEQGGIYKPPQYPTLQQIKLQLMDRDNVNSGANSEPNMEEEIAFQRFDEKDKQIDDGLREFIDVNRRVRNKMINANQAIDTIGQKARKALKKADKLTERVQKADRDLAQILKTYQRPSQLCLNICLILMVLALVGVIITLFKSPTF